jgi:hypothetical protein
VGHQNCDATREAAVNVIPFWLISVIIILLGRILECKEEEVTREGRKSHVENMYVLYLSLNTGKAKDEVVPLLKHHSMKTYT